MKRSGTSLIGWLAGFALLFQAPAAWAEPVFPRGAGVGLEPPAGMSVSTTFLGFQKGKASILLTELPAAAFAQIDPQRAQFAERIGAKAAEDFSASGAKGFIVRGTQALGGQSYRKWAVVLGSPATTTMVTVQVPADETDISDAAIEAALRTITLRAPRSKDEQVAALPFKVGDLAGFRIVRTFMGAGLILTEGPKDEDPTVEQPSVIVTTSLDRPAPAKDRAAFAQAYLRSIKAIRVTDVEAAKVFEADGAEWAEVHGKANEGKSDAAVDVTLYLRFGPSDFIAVLGSNRTGGPDMRERVRKLALSVKPAA